MELHRQQQQLANLESFLAYQLGGGQACQFILDWTHHQRLRQELHAFRGTRQTIDVQADLCIQGQVGVMAAATGEAGEYSLAPASSPLNANLQANFTASTVEVKKATASIAMAAGGKPRPLATFDLSGLGSRQIKN